MNHRASQQLNRKTCVHLYGAILPGFGLSLHTGAHPNVLTEALEACYKSPQPNRLFAAVRGTLGVQRVTNHTHPRVTPPSPPPSPLLPQPYIPSYVEGEKLNNLHQDFSTSSLSVQVCDRIHSQLIHPSIPLNGDEPAWTGAPRHHQTRRPPASVPCRCCVSRPWRR